MASSADNVRVGASGIVRGAPLGTTLPTTSAASPNAAFKDVGYVSEDGVVQSTSTDVNDIRAWGGDTVRTVQTSHDLTFAFTMLETNDAVLENYYGNAAADVVEVTGAQGVRQSWIIDVLDGDAVIRIVIPDGQITERDDITYATADAIGYGVTVTAYPDDDGVKAYIYTDAAS